MPETGPTTVYNAYRRKVTFACDPCRKRRAKCSGTLPCTFCSENQKICTFDAKNRGRRGPRPRQPAGQAPRVTRDIAPAPPRPTEGTDVAAVHEVDSRNTIARLAIVASEADDSCGDDDLHEDDYPPVSVWKPGLESILSGQNFASVDLVCHLVELFCSRATSFLRLLLPPLDFLDGIRQGIMHKSVILAVSAYSLRYSVHQVAKDALAEGLDQHFERCSRNELHLFHSSGLETSQIQTFCVLIEYNASKGNGRQAWVDIAIGRSLLQIARARDNLTSEQISSLERSKHYLEVVQACHSIGHISLQPCYPTWYATGDRSSKSHQPTEHASSQLLELHYIFLRIQQLCSTPFPNHSPPSWSLDSAFRAVQNDLDLILLRQNEVSRSGTNGAQAPAGETTESIVCSLIWHCCIIALNRTFLPIPERIKESDDNSSPVTINCTNFPSIPQLFLEERINRCEASAAAICTICKYLIKNEGFFSNALWIGFACVQSALVLINQLHRNIKPYKPTVVDNLKFVFIVVRAVSSFYAPAQDWVDVLIRAHDINTPLKTIKTDSAEAFANYFDRFADLKEPSFVPLEPKHAIRPESHANGHPSSVLQHTHDAIQAVSPKHAKTSRLKSGEDWLRHYVQHLSEDIEADGAGGAGGAGGANGETGIDFHRAESSGIYTLPQQHAAQEGNLNPPIVDIGQVADTAPSFMIVNRLMSPSVGAEDEDSWLSTSLGLTVNPFINSDFSQFEDLITPCPDLDSFSLLERLLAGDEINDKTAGPASSF